MDYVSLEDKLLESARKTYPELPSEILIKLYENLRSIDWLNLFQSPKRNIPALRDLITETPELEEIISTLTTGMVLRHNEFRKGAPEHSKLMDVIVRSLEWRCKTTLFKDVALDEVSLDEEETIDILTRSPDLVVMYILSNGNFLHIGS